jgi:hypothetical protein
VVLNEVIDDGGSPILSYELQMGSPLLNNWYTISGGVDDFSLALEHT